LANGCTTRALTPVKGDLIGVVMSSSSLIRPLNTLEVVLTFPFSTCGAACAAGGATTAMIGARGDSGVNDSLIAEIALEIDFPLEASEALFCKSPMIYLPDSMRMYV